MAIDPAAIDAISKSAEAVNISLSKGQIVYGVNTGFGGNADTRTQAVEELQREVVRGLHYGILADVDQMNTYRPLLGHNLSNNLFKAALPLDHPLAATCMPEVWVRASMLIRLNSLAGGASGVKVTTVDVLAQLINKNVVPRIPVRGSISASGDLSPLSYVGGLMQGKSNITAWIGDRLSAETRRVVHANSALREADIKPVILGAKEGLAIVNGTAVSAGVAALALHEALGQAALSQVLTAMTVEALCGTDESFDPFIARIRPHPGQVDSARNIFVFLAQSKLVFRNDGSEEASLRQDRYSIRTASQWIGPVLEDLILAHEQILIEINSVTDNPVVDVGNDIHRVLHGGNFQAKVVTSAMEKTRQGCQTLGRMLFVQCTELINPSTNRGLSPNLVVDEPSESFLWKGTDILIAALQSELGFLANPVGSHVQTAEMGNQALNSLALISSRYTLDALDVLSQMAAAHLLALCQALDLRAMHAQFLSAFLVEFNEITQQILAGVLLDRKQMGQLQDTLWAAFERRLDQTANLDSDKRFAAAIESLQSIILKRSQVSSKTLEAMASWTLICSDRALEIFTSTRTQYMNRPDASPLLGSAACRMYRFVRDTLGVPFFGENYIRTPTTELAEGNPGQNSDYANPPTVGTLISTVYDSIRTGALYNTVMECFREIA